MNPTDWVNRLNLPTEELGVVPDGAAGDLNELARFIEGWNSSSDNDPRKPISFINGLRH